MSMGGCGNGMGVGGNERGSKGNEAVVGCLVGKGGFESY